MAVVATMFWLLEATGAGGAAKAELQECVVVVELAFSTFGIIMLDLEPVLWILMLGTAGSEARATCLALVCGDNDC
jgi:hypothetical protein